MKPVGITRRGYLESALTLSLASQASAQTRPQAANPPPPDSSFDAWVEVYSDNLRHNVHEVTRRVQGRPILAVIKNNGYGLGVENVARIFGEMPEIAGCAVVKLSEALRVSEIGFNKPIVLMGPFDESSIEDIAAKNIFPMVYTPIGPAFDRVARKLRRPANVHICVDTGLGREGVPYREADGLIRDLAGRNSMRIAGTMMTFTEDKEFDLEQLRRFEALTRPLEAAGVGLGRKHAASSFALFQHPVAFLDMVRPGMALFGIYSDPEFRGQGILDLRPAVALKTRVIYVKQISKDESAGYDRVYVAKRDTWLATLPVGHADGVPRSSVEGARVRIGGGMFPIVAVSASHLIVEIGDEPLVKAGDIATVFDWNEGSRPEDFAVAAKSSVYDLTMHLNPLLRRRVL